MSFADSFNEKKLLIRLADDDKSAFDALYHYYEPRLRLFLYPFVTDQNTLNAILQDVFVKLWIKRTDLVGIEFLEYYLQRMAKNRLLDLLRLRRIKEEHEVNYSRQQLKTANVTSDHVQLKEYMAIARKGISLLPERRKLIFSLHVLDGLSLDEVAGELNISKDVVKKQLQHAKNFLKEYVSKKGDLPVTVGAMILGSMFS